jgi:hypothetical protein
MSPTVTQYLEHARQSEWYAAHTDDEEDRKFLLRIARHWRKLARECDKRQRVARPSAKMRTMRRSRKTIRGLKGGLTVAVADHRVAQLKERGDPWRLNEEQPTAKPPST